MKISGVDNTVFRSSMPITKADIEQLHNLGINTIFSLEDMPEEARKAAQEKGLHIIPIPVPDESIPKPRQVAYFLNLVESEKKKGCKCVVHCQAGRERTGVMVALYLVREKGMHPLIAYNHVRTVEPGLQKNFILEFGEFILRHGKNAAEAYLNMPPRARAELMHKLYPNVFGKPGAPKVMPRPKKKTIRRPGK